MYQGRNSRQAHSQSDGIIIIPKRLRAEWLDFITELLCLSDLDVRIGSFIAKHINSRTGEAFIAQPTIAKRLKKHIRTVQRSIYRLEAAGVLLVTRLEHQVLRRDGRPVYGGRGIANRYRLATNGELLVASKTGRRFKIQIERDEALTAVRDTRPPCTPLETGPQSRAPNPKSTAPQSEMDGVTAVPTLTDTSYQNPIATSLIGRPLEHPLGKAAAILLAHIQQPAFDNWFRLITLESINGDTLCIGTKSAFHRDWLRTNYEIAVLDSWNSVYSRVGRVEFVVASAGSLVDRNR